MPRQARFQTKDQNPVVALTSRHLDREVAGTSNDSDVD